LFEQQGEITDAKIDSESALKMQQDAARGDEHESGIAIRQVKVQLKRLAYSHYQLQQNIKQEQEKLLVALREEFERKADEAQQMFRKKQKGIRRQFIETRKADIKKIEAQKDVHIQKLMQKHQQVFDDIKTYYRDITHNNLDLIKSLKDEVGEMKKKEQSDEKSVHDIHNLNAKLSQPLQKNLTLVEDLKKDLEAYEKDKILLTDTKDRIAVLDLQLKNLSWEHEILEQKYQQLLEERDELQSKLKNKVCEVHQKVGFHNLVLEKKLAAMKDDLEKTDVALAEILTTAANLRPEQLGGVRSTLDEVMAAKNATITALQQQILALKMKHNDMIVSFEETLLKHEIPPENLGFAPQPMALESALTAADGAESD